MKHFKVDSVMVTTLKGQKIKVPLIKNRPYELSDRQRDQLLDLVWCGFWSLRYGSNRKELTLLLPRHQGVRFFFPHCMKEHFSLT